MAPTRAQRSTAATDQATAAKPKSANPVEQVEDMSKPSLTSNNDRPKESGAETIGSRLRKRRRTGSPPPEESSPALKRAYSKRAASAISNRGQAEIVVQETPSGANTRSQRTARTSAQGKDKAFETIQVAGDSGNENATEVVEQGPQQTYEEQRSAPESATQDFNNIIADIISHGETVDSHYASQGYDAMGTVDTESFTKLGASLHLKTQSLPILDNLATQILNTMAKSTYQEILTIATKPDSDPGQAYATLKSLFDHTKKVYSIQEPFLSPYQLGLVEQMQVDTIRKANMATFVSSVFGSKDVGFYHLNENFLDTFLADGNRLLKSQAQLFLDLKTQAYISAVAPGERSKEEILEDLFPQDLEEQLLKRRPGAKQPAPSEVDFIQRARNRRKALLEEPSTPAAVASLPEKYIWEDFLRDISAYVSKNFEAIVGIAARKTSRSGRASNYFTIDQKQQLSSQQQNRMHQHQAQQRQDRRLQRPQQTRQDSRMIESGDTTEIPNPQVSFHAADTNNIAEKAARAADFAMQDYRHDPGLETAPLSQQHHDMSTQGQEPLQAEHQLQQPPPQIEYHFEHPLHPDVPAPPPPQYFHQDPFQQSQQMQPQWQGQGQMMSIGQLHQSYSDQPLIPYPTQSAPTQILYERARMAATAKASPSNRRSGHPSQRRPWTVDEENSLMAGLDRVKGPHWSQILAMFGPGGTVNEVLKDRNQVQLKDKARNLKLFFLKSGIEVPYYLQFVTGELKTRAPAQAAKNEAKIKSTSEEIRPYAESMVTLAGGSTQDMEQEFPGTEPESERRLQNGAMMPTGSTTNGVRMTEDIDNEAAIHPAFRTSAGIGAMHDEHGIANVDAPTDGIDEAPLHFLGDQHGQHHLQQQSYQQMPGEAGMGTGHVKGEVAHMSSVPPSHGLSFQGGGGNGGGIGHSNDTETVTV